MSGNSLATDRDRNAHDRAYHAAAHAVALFRFGLPVRQLALDEPVSGPARCAELGMPALLARDAAGNRAEIERFAVVLHAGAAAEDHLHADSRCTLAPSSDHASVHRMLRWIEEDDIVERVWCRLLWQRAYAFITNPWQWPLVRTVAEALLVDAPLSARDATTLLAESAARLEIDPTIPPFQLLGTTLRAPSCSGPSPVAEER